MKTTINKSEFRDAFMRMGRKDNFSYQGLGVLFDYFEECNPDMELDVIAICCEFNEETPDEIRANYRLDADDDLMDYLQNNTQIAGVTDDGSIIYAAF